MTQVAEGLFIYFCIVGTDHSRLQKDVGFRVERCWKSVQWKDAGLQDDRIQPRGRYANSQRAVICRT